MAARSEGQDCDRYRHHDVPRSNNRWLPSEFDQGSSCQERYVIPVFFLLPFTTSVPWNVTYLVSCDDADVAADVIAIVFRTYLAEQTIDHLASILKKGGVKDLLLFFPPNKREDKVLDEFLRKQGLVQVADWWTKKKYAILKEEVIKAIREHLQNGDSNPDVGRYHLGSGFMD